MGLPDPLLTQFSLQDPAARFVPCAGLSMVRQLATITSPRKAGNHLSQKPFPCMVPRSSLPVRGRRPRFGRQKWHKPLFRCRMWQVHGHLPTSSHSAAPHWRFHAAASGIFLRLLAFLTPVPQAQVFGNTFTSCLAAAFQTLSLPGPPTPWSHHIQRKPFILVNFGETLFEPDTTPSKRLKDSPLGKPDQTKRGKKTPNLQIIILGVLSETAESLITFVLAFYCCYDKLLQTEGLKTTVSLSYHSEGWSLYRSHGGKILCSRGCVAFWKL